MALEVPTLVNIHVQDGMRSTRRFVHLLRSHFSILHACVYDVDCLVNCLNGHFNKVLNEDLSVVLLSYLEVLAFMRIQKVLNLVLVNLVETQVYLPFENGAFLLLST
jgi:hypothetical protein